MNQQQLQHAAKELLQARADGVLFSPAAGRAGPRDSQDAYAIHAYMMKTLGPVGGWKIGAPSPEAESSYAPLPASGLYQSPARLAAQQHRLRGIEVEVAFRLGCDLPPRERPYDLDEIVAAIDAAVPVIEEVESRLLNRERAGPLWALADHQSHGALILGEPLHQWIGRDTEAVHVRLMFDDNTIIDKACINRGGDPIIQVQRLANSVGRHCGGLRAGQIVTTGSLTGLDYAPEGAHVDATLEGLGTVSLKFV